MNRTSPTANVLWKRVNLALKALPEERLFQLPAASVGILSSSFNPPTLAHEQFILHAKETLGLEKMVLLLSSYNADDGFEKAPMSDRISMMQAMANDLPGTSVWLTASAMTVEIADLFLDKFPHADRLVFLMGADSLSRMLMSKYYHENRKERDVSLQAFFSKAEIAYLDRSGIDADQVRDRIENGPGSVHQDRIVRLPKLDSINNISSTRARRDIYLHGHTSLVPPGVMNYIQSVGLYRKARRS